MAVPGIQLVYDYLPLAPGVAILSSGGQYSGHADFVNSWNQRALTALVNDCLNENRVFWFLTIVAATGVAAWVVTRLLILKGAGPGLTH